MTPTTSQPAASPRARRTSPRPGTGLFLRHVVAELRLAMREPLVLAFVFAFPVVVVLVLGGIFDADDEAFEGALPSDYYAVGYVAVAIAAIGLIMLPTHIASYRERGVLGRFQALGLPGWLFPGAVGVVSLVMAIVAAGLVLATSALTYGLPSVDDPSRSLAFGLLGLAAFTSLGILLGWLMPTARSAQGVGMLLFLPMFLLAGGGPPPEAMSPIMRDIGQVMPLTHVMRALQEPWLAIGDGVDHAIILAGLFVASAAGWIVLSGRAVRR